MKNMCCPCTGAYLPRFIPCLILGFVFILGFNMFLHGQLLMSSYELTQQLWRTPEDMQAHFKFLLLTQFLIVFLTGVIYAQNHEGRGVCEGIRYGLMIGALIGVLRAAPYAWTPVSPDLAFAWFAGGLAEGLGLGMIYSLLYRPACCGGGKCEKGSCKCNKGGCDADGADQKDAKKDKGACGTGC